MNGKGEINNCWGGVETSAIPVAQNYLIFWNFNRRTEENNE
jgi:hypothetical protein